jgi:hypothetical protein
MNIVPAPETMPPLREEDFEIDECVTNSYDYQVSFRNKETGEVHYFVTVNFVDLKTQAQEAGFTWYDPVS